ncbi:MAG: rhomboid family intramembrane serine protease [Aquimonas sp.]|nr:rhomboid family intramembrane serine protease [Aquimonas sp.]
MDLPLHETHPDPRQQAELDRRRFRSGLLLSAGFVIGLWWIKALEMFLDTSFSGLGTYPGELSGLIGVLTAPLIHGSFAHLLGNSFALLVLGTLVFASFPRAGWRALPLIWVAAGLAVWLFGRPSHHIGASGLTHGLMFLILALGITRRDRVAVATGFIAFFLYGGMLLTVLPREPGVSWEYHLAGGLFGFAAGLLWRRLDPLPPRKRYSWEIEEELEAEQRAAEASTWELQAPLEVKPLWSGPGSLRAGQPQDETGRGVLLRFPPRRLESSREPPESPHREP